MLIKINIYTCTCTVSEPIYMCVYCEGAGYVHVVDVHVNICTWSVNYDFKKKDMQRIQGHIFISQLPDVKIGSYLALRSSIW